jgi:hypothetical protein
MSNPTPVDPKTQAAMKHSADVIKTQAAKLRQLSAMLNGLDDKVFS